jgi:microcystin-dependent protein
MSDPFIAEIKIMSTPNPANFPLRGWAACDGQLLQIGQNQALFAVVGTSFGGNGQTTFGLPDFRGRIPVHTGNTRLVGQSGGQEFHTLTSSEMPQHTHPGQVVTTNAATGNPTGNMLASVPSLLYRTSATNLTTLHPASVTNYGGSQPHENRQPYLVLGFIIALQGIFPSRN